MKDTLRRVAAMVVCRFLGHDLRILVHNPRTMEYDGYCARCGEYLSGTY